jgi:hypothetical protein
MFFVVVFVYDFLLTYLVIFVVNQSQTKNYCLFTYL